MDHDPTLDKEMGITSSNSDSDSDVECHPKRPKLAKSKPFIHATQAKTKKMTHKMEYLPPINKPHKSILSDSMDLRKELIEYLDDFSLFTEQWSHSQRMVNWR